MQVFKTYFKLLKHYKGIVILYVAIFFSVALIMSTHLSSSGEKEFEETKLDIAIIDQDNKTFGNALMEYFENSHNLTAMEYDENKIAEELYWKKLDYVLIIPKGFEESLTTKDTEKMELSSMKVPGSFDSNYFEAELDLYISKFSGLVGAGYSVSDAEQELLELQKEKAKVRVASFVNENQHDISTVFFIYIPYLFIALGMNGIGIILLRFNEKEIKDRTECGALSMQARIKGLTAAIFIFGLMLLAIVLVTVGVLSKGSIYTDVRFPYFMLNILSMLLFGLSLGFFTGTIAKDDQMINGMTNVISLVLCFLGGVFVPMEFFSDGVTKVAKFFPTYWYVVTNDAIGAMNEMSTGLFTDVLTQVGLVACYALVIFAVTVVVIFNKRKRTA